MKKLLSLILTLCMVASMVPVFAEEVIMPDNLFRYDVFRIEKNGDEYTIVGIAENIESNEIIVPEKLHGWIYDKNGRVEYLSEESYSIAPEAFKYCTSVRKIEFENGIEVIPHGLCEGMTYLEEVVLPQSVYAIDNGAFRLCENLKKIDLSKVQYIGRSAFEGCTSLDNITLSAKTEGIEAYAFYGCESLQNVQGLSDAIAIGQDAFMGTQVTPYNEVEYVYLAQNLFKNQDDIVEMTVDALSWFPKDDDPESEKYDFTTDDKEIIKDVLDIINSCRYRTMKGVLASDGTTLRISVKYSDGAEFSEDFKESTVVVDNVKYQLISEDYWKIADYLKAAKTKIEKKSPFADIPYASKYYEAAAKLSELGIMAGYEDNTFKPQNTLTRGEAAAIIVRLLKLDDEITEGETMFADVPENHWASGYINEAVGNGIINGQGDGTFAPEEEVTFGQMVKMLVCALGYEPVALANGGWANGGYIFAGSKIGLTKGIEGTSKEILSRGKAAELCYKALSIELMDNKSLVLEGKTILNVYWGIEE